MTVYIASKKLTYLDHDILVKSTTKTTSDITLYVRTTGNDNNDGLTTGTALLTIPEAISRIPEFIAHTVVVDIGEGTFGGFVLTSRVYTEESASLTIRGVTALATGLASGTATGTATGGTTNTLIDAGQAWTVNDLRGRLALVNGEYRVIYSNDATSLTFVGLFTLTTNGKAYQIVEQKTNLNTLGNVDSVVMVSNQMSLTINPTWTIQDIKITTPVGATNYGMQHLRTHGGYLLRVAIISQANQTGFRAHTVFGAIKIVDTYITGGSTGFYGVQFGNMPSTAEFGFYRVFCYNMSTYGIRLFYCTQVYITYAYIDTCTTGIFSNKCLHIQRVSSIINTCSTAGVQTIADLFNEISACTITSCGIGFYIMGALQTEITSGSIIQNSTSHGVQLYDSSHAYGPAKLYVSSSKIINNGGSGIYARGDKTITLYSLAATGGTGNTRFGIELEDGAKAFVRSGIIANPLTGAMGDAAVTDAKAAITWAGSFGVNLNIVVDATGVGTLIKRRD